MAKNKLKRFEEIKSFPNVLEIPENTAGNWKNIFGNENPVTLELACGAGEYTIALARRFSQRNFIGIDIKGARIFKGAKIAAEEKLTNALFLRTQIDHITKFFSKDEVKEIWILFPDPFPSKPKWKKRLTSTRFLDRYRQLLIRGGKIHLKTDDDDLFEFTLQTIAKLKLNILHSTNNLYASTLQEEVLNEKTFYENIHLAKGKTIKYVCFELI